jgi:hypothetical protein
MFEGTVVHLGIKDALEAAASAIVRTDTLLILAQACLHRQGSNSGSTPKLKLIML